MSPRAAEAGGSAVLMGPRSSLPLSLMTLALFRPRFPASVYIHPGLLEPCFPEGFLEILLVSNDGELAGHSPGEDIVKNNLVSLSTTPILTAKDLRKDFGEPLDKGRKEGDVVFGVMETERRSRHFKLANFN